MDPASRYQVLHNEDDDSEVSTSDQQQQQQPCISASAQRDNQALPVGGETSGTRTQGEADSPPPPYASIDLGATAAAPETSFQSHFPVPPPYSVATSLPTYDEAEKAKAASMATPAVEVIPQDDDFTPRDDFSDADLLRVGNDGIFMLAFFMALLFNWIGFCLSFCLTNTMAGRYGAVCGFGLSLVKWTFIVRFSNYFSGYFNGQFWLWWIFLLLGLLLFFRGLVNYLKVRNLSDNMAMSHRARLFFFY